MSRSCLILLAASLAALLFGCGGAAHQGVAISSGAGRAAFTIKWPERARLIPLAANSIQVTINQDAVTIAQQVLPRPANGGQSTLVFDPLPVGTFTVTATAFPNADPSGTAQATATIPLAIAANHTTNFSLTMNSTIDHLESSPAPPAIEVGQRYRLVVVAKDASGNVVMTTPSKFQWTSLQPGIAIVDENGIVTALAAGSPHIGAVETESGKQLDIPLSITAAVGLVSWWRGEGNGKDSIGTNDASPTANVTFVPGVVGQAFNFNGFSSGATVADSNSLKITDSLTIDVRVFINAFPTEQQDLGMILFRGDQRFGFDPYYLATSYDGTIRFHIANDQGSELIRSIPTGRWVHITASLNGATGAQSLYFDGQLVAQTITSVRPSADLDPTQLPGVGIGNHSVYPRGIFNFPFNGVIDELKLYNRVVAPGI